MSRLLPVDPKELGRLLALAAVGLEMVVPIGLGWLLDEYFGWTPWGVIGGVVFGFVGGVLHLLLLASFEERRNRPHATQPPKEDL